MVFLLGAVWSYHQAFYGQNPGGERQSRGVKDLFNRQCGVMIVCRKQKASVVDLRLSLVPEPRE
jgi:hypothetical protein